MIRPPLLCLLGLLASLAGSLAETHGSFPVVSEVSRLRRGSHPSREQLAGLMQAGASRPRPAPTPRLVTQHERGLQLTATHAGGVEDIQGGRVTFSAAAEGDPEALRLLSELYEAGRGVQKDPGVALVLLGQAAERGKSLPIKDLGRCAARVRSAPSYPRCSKGAARVRRPPQHGVHTRAAPHGPRGPPGLPCRV